MNTSYSWKSVGIRTGLVALAVKAGHDANNANHFASKVLGTVRKDIADNGAKSIEVVKKDGNTREIAVKDKDATHKASGKGVNAKLTWGGERQGLLLARCSFLTRALVAQDEALFGLEAQGYGLSFVPEASGEVAELLGRQLAEFKPTATSTPASAPAPVNT